MIDLFWGTVTTLCVLTSFLIFYVGYPSSTTDRGESRVQKYVLDPRGKQEMGKRQLAAIEGSIGSGKSTWLRVLAAHYGDRLHTHSEFVVPELLEGFYKERDRLAMMFQTAMVYTRLYVLMQMQPGQHISDRGIFGDLVFCVKQQLDGKISRRDKQLYNAVVRNYLDRTDWLWYVYSTPQQSFDRVRKRQTVDSQLVPIEYLEDIHWLHVYLILALLSRPNGKTARVQIRVRISEDLDSKTVEAREVHPLELFGDVPQPLSAAERTEKLVSLTHERVPLPNGRFPGLPERYRFVHPEPRLRSWMQFLANHPTDGQLIFETSSDTPTLFEFWRDYLIQM